MSRGPRDKTVIRTPDRRLRVFVGSTLGELAEERRPVSRALTALRLTPVMFELRAWHAAVGVGDHHYGTPNGIDRGPDSRGVVVHVAKPRSTRSV